MNGGGGCLFEDRQRVELYDATTGTTPTTYDPAGTVNRLQMAAFLSRSVDRTLQRDSRRAALNQFWTTQANAGLTLTTVGAKPQIPIFDGSK